MTVDDLKPYIVQVKDGSGCLFNTSATNDCSYILTAKHLFEGVKRDEDGNEQDSSLKDGEQISIIRMIKNGDNWEEVEIPFIFERGKTYFPHKIADAAILKIDYLNGFDKIATTTGLPENIRFFCLYGFPSKLSGNKPGNKDTSYALTRLIVSAGNTYTAQLDNPVLNRDDIEGMSGGGILYPDKENGLIYIAGVQSEMKHALCAHGQINFVPINYFEEIIEYTEYKDELRKLFPPHMCDFSFLREECFDIPFDAIDEDIVAAIRTVLKNKALNVIGSDITPVGIKELFKHRLLIDENRTELLTCKNIWMAWLEFLTIMNIIKYEDINMEMLSDIFNTYRLKQAHVDDWTTLFYNELPKSDYTGLKFGSTVIVNSKKSPNSERHFNIKQGKMIDTYRVYDKSGFKTDQGMDPYTSFNFVHIDYFRIKCFVNKLDEYAHLTEVQLLDKLKQEYHELLN